MKILVVDDSDLEQVRLRALLEKLGHQVLIAADGVDALEAFVVAGPDLILLDVMMPVMDGLETARRIRELHLPWVPIVFLSSNVEPEDIASGIEAGGDDYLSKPVHGVVLAAKLRAMERIAAMKNLISQVAAPDLKAEIAELAAVDRRSGLATEQAGKTMLAREFVRCSRTVQSLSLVLVSIDGYDRLLAEHGEEIADGCIRSLTVALQSNASRISDFIARHGDAAFLIVMPDTPMTGAVRVGERVRSTINDLESAHSLEGRAPLPHFTVSVGVATAIPQNGHEAQQLELAVDAMLSQAQAEGGDRVHATAADVPFRLTARELECLQWSAIGKSSWEISSILNISESAVNFHMANIRSKFNVGSRRQAVVQAIRFGLIRPS